MASTMLCPQAYHDENRKPSLTPGSTPITIATHNGGPRDIITHNEDGFLVYDNPNSICWGVNQVFSNFAHAQWMGSRGRVKAASVYSWDAIAERTEAIYHELLYSESL